MVFSGGRVAGGGTGGAHPVPSGGAPRGGTSEGTECPGFGASEKPAVGGVDGSGAFGSDHKFC